MRIRFHRFLMMLLMLALPVQTFASASMLACAAGHPAPVEHTVAAEAMSGCHESEQVPPASHNCKHCTVCALASALPIPAADFPREVVNTPHFQQAMDDAFSGHIPDGPERPPRTSLA